MDAVDFVEDRECAIHLAVVDIMTRWLKKEEDIDKAARHKIEAQKRAIPEGSAEMGNPLS